MLHISLRYITVNYLRSLLSNASGVSASKVRALVIILFVILGH